MRQLRWLAAAAALALLSVHAGVTYGQSARTRASARHTELLIVVDGLRPDSVTRAEMPRLSALGQRGVVFTAHHSVFPTVTRVNASSIVTGAYPESHGLLGNTIYIPSVDRTRGIDTGERANLEAVARAEGRLLTAPTLGEILQADGRSLVALSSGSTGSAYLLNTAPEGTVIHTDYVKPQTLAPKVLALLGPPPAHATPNDPQNQRAIDAYLKLCLDDLRPDVAILWLNDPDGTAHANGLGAPLTLTSLRLVDAGIGRIEDGLRARGLLASTNVIVTSDHGFSTETGELNLPKLIKPFAKPLDDGSPDIVVAEGAIYFRRRDPARVAAVVELLQQRPEVGAIFTKMPLPGTLSYDVARWNHARSGDILVSANWTANRNRAGIAGTTTQDGIAGHGTSSPFDIHNTLIAAGPEFREHAISSLPTANVDLAPTLLRLLGLAPAPSMTGRVIEEGLLSRSPMLTPSQTTETARTSDGKYVLTAHISTVGKYRYLDRTDVRRR